MVDLVTIIPATLHIFFNFLCKVFFPTGTPLYNGLSRLSGIISNGRHKLKRSFSFASDGNLLIYLSRMLTRRRSPASGVG